MSERNWSGTLTYGAAEIARPRSLDELADLLDGDRPVRVLGTRHSFSTVADTSGLLLDMTGIPADLTLDDANGEVSFSPGARYADVARFLLERGRALPNTGSLPHINVVGAVSTGTHGSGNPLRGLAAAVRALELLTTTGEQVRLEHGDRDFAGSVVGLGALGVVTRATLATEPTYDVRQDAYRDVPWDGLLADPESAFAAGYSVSAFTDWSGETIPEAVVKQRVDQGGNPAPTDFLGTPSVGAWSGASLVSSEAESLTLRGVAGPWCERLPHFRIDSPPSHGAELQSEWFVPLSSASDALSALREIGATLRDALIISEVRTMAADDLWLSPAFERDALCLHFTWRPELAVALPCVRAVEQALEPFAPRPHWGKVFDLDAFEVDAAYPRSADFRGLAERLDPVGRLRNDFLTRTVWACA